MRGVLGDCFHASLCVISGPRAANCTLSGKRTEGRLSLRDNSAVSPGMPNRHLIVACHALRIGIDFGWEGP